MPPITGTDDATEPIAVNAAAPTQATYPPSYYGYAPPPPGVYVPPLPQSSPGPYTLAQQTTKEKDEQQQQPPTYQYPPFYGAYPPWAGMPPQVAFGNMTSPSRAPPTPATETPVATPEKTTTA